MYKYAFISICIGTAALAALCVGFFVLQTRPPDEVTYKAPKQTIEKKEQAPVLQAMSDVFTYAPGNFSFKIPAGWEVVEDVSTIPVLARFDAPHFGLMKQGTACYVAYYDAVLDGEYYEQIGFGERTFSGLLQFDSQWYGPSEILPEDFTFDFQKVQHVTGEFYDIAGAFVVPTFVKQPHLVLYDGDGGMVQQSCTDDIKLMTQSWAQVYALTTLTKKSLGYLYTQQAEETPGSKRPALLFYSDADAITYSLGAAPAEWGRLQTFDAQGNISGITKTGTLASFNVFSGEAKQTGPLISGSHVVDYYQYRDKAWVLGAQSDACGEINCPTILHEKNSSGIFMPLHKKALERAGRIVGYIPEKEHLVLMGGYGDAGCSSSTYTVFDTKKNVVVETVQSARCEGDVETAAQAQATARIELLREKAGASKHGKLLRVSDGQLDFADESALREGLTGTEFVQTYF